MKKIAISLCMVFVLASAFAIRHPFKSGIHGIIDPPEGAKKVWAISGKDTFSTEPVSGNFSLEIRPGNWNLLVEAVSPYKNAVVENINVQDGQSTDVGVIKLNTQ